MAVIPFPLDLSPQGPNPRMSWTLRSITALHRSPMNGVPQTLERPRGEHWAARLPYDNLAEDRRARLITFAASCRGYASRFHMPVFGWTRRGSFPTSELLTNNTFASGTTGYSSTAADYTLSAADGILRSTRVGVASAGSHIVLSPNAAVTAYAPYVARIQVANNRLTSGQHHIAIRQASGGTLLVSSSATAADGLYSLTYAGPETTLSVSLRDSGNTGPITGEYVEVSYMSLSRCALVDNGSNLLLQSDEFDTTWTATRASVDDQTAGTADPLGTSTADSIIEDATAANSHFLSQAVTVSAAAADYAYSVALKAGARTWAALFLRESAGPHDARVYVNLSTGALGAASVTGANIANARASITSLGDGWYRVSLVARKVSAATTLTAFVVIAEADGDFTFNGDGTSNIYAWRATLAQSSVPTRLSATTTAASSGTSQTGGALYLKGLQASTAGLLLQGDPAEIIIGTTSQFVRTRAPLNSDAAGLGYWEFEPPLRVSPSDGAAVIIQNPLCKMMLDSNEAGWTDRAGGFADLEFSAVEDTYPS